MKLPKKQKKENDKLENLSDEERKKLFKKARELRNEQHIKNFEK
jgi:hypothetical protein